jgi:hypothetical protein
MIREGESMDEVAVRAPENKREFPRVTPDARAPVRVNINGNDFIEVINAVDISEGGIRLSVKHRFEDFHVDRRTSFIGYLPIPINKPFRFEGRITHVANESIGVQFTSLSTQARTLVRSYVNGRRRMN